MMIDNISLQTIDPDMAREILGFNTGNFRNPDKLRIEKYANDMANGNWKFSGDSIKISDGVLLDGQHRLLAVIKSGKSIQTIIVKDLIEDATYIDRGKPRTLSQWFRHLGYKNYTALAATGSLIYLHDNGFWLRSSVSVKDRDEATIIKYVKNNLDALQATFLFVNRPYLNKIIPLSIISTVAHIGTGRGTAPENNAVAAWFWNGIANGSGLKENDPPLTLRNRLLAGRGSERLTPLQVRTLVTKAWNYAVRGEELTPRKLQLRSVGPLSTILDPKILEAKDHPDG